MSRFQPVFTNEFLEKQLNRKVFSFTVGPGSKPGDNFMGVVYALDVKVKPQSCLHEVFDKDAETIHLVAKCYPHNPARHEYLNQASVFKKEVLIYQILLFKFQSFLNQINIPLELPIAKFLAGRAVDFSKQIGIPKPKLTSCGAPKILRKGYIKEETFPYGPLDNFLVLTDVRKTWGYTMIRQHTCLDLDHCSLVIKELAKVHAISWAYRLKTGKKKLSDQFCFLKQPSWSETADIESFCNFNFQSVLKTLETYLGKDSPVVAGTKRFQTHSVELLHWFQNDASEVNGIKEMDLNSFMRIVPNTESETSENYVSWNVFTHGDCWTNNMLFKYDQITQVPEKVIFVDFQVSKDACPTVDLAYMLYISTNQNFRKRHLNELLRLYHDSFISYSSILNVKILPGFSLDSLKRRFHRSKLYAYLMCIICLPIILRDHSIDLDNVKTTEMKASEIFAEILNGTTQNTLLHERIVEVATDFYNDGII